MNIMAKSSLAHAKSSGSTLYAVLSLNVLQSLDHDKIIALNEIGIFSLGDLLHFKPIIYAQILVSVSNRDIGHDISVERYLDNSYLSTLQSDIPNLPIVAIEGLGASMEAKFNTTFGVTVINELALFEPFLEAQQYLLPDKEVFNERPSAPEDLLPKILGSVHSIARFNSYIKSSQINLGNENLSLEANEIDELNSELYNIFTTNKFKLYVGFIAGFKQSWMNVGTHLGEIIHSLALAPGESRNISIIEWYRRQSSSRDEKTKVDEKLSNSLVHSRALNEVVKTTAMEHLSGSTEIDATTKTSGYGITASGAGGSSNGNSAGGSGNVSGTATDGVLGLGANLVGGFAKSALSTITGAIGLSAVFSKNEQVGTLKSESSGVRAVLGETQQNINDSTVQNSSNIRSLYSTIVVTDEQAETENIQTKNVTNYNHSHSLTIQYYEVLQRYEVAIKLDSWTPVVYLPFKPISFDVNVVQKYWHLLRTPIISSFPELFDRFNAFFKGFNPLNPNFDISKNVKIESIKATSSSSGGTYWYNESSLGGFGGSHPAAIGNPGFTLTMTINNPAVTGYPLAFPTFELPVTPPLNLSDLKEIFLKWSTVHLGKAPTNPNDEIKVDINLEFSLIDEDNNSVIVKKTYSRIIKFAELYAGINTPIIVTTDLSNDLENSLTSTELFNSTDVKEEIEKHFKTYKYAYTRYLLSSIEGDQLSDIIESLSFDSPGTLFLENYIHTNPIAITENYLVFKHKKIPVPAGVNPCSPDFEGLNDPIWTALILLQCNVEEYKNAKDTKSLDTVFLPTAGVFAEAILGRSNASEFVDPRRFWNWQDSPIPFSAPQIAAIQAGNHTVTDPTGVLTPNVPTSNLNIINPPQYALPTTLSDALQAVQKGDMFRDMSKTGELVSILGSLATLASTTATLAGNLSGDAAENALNSAVELGKQVAGMVDKAAETWKSTYVAPPAITPTEKAAALNVLENLPKGSEDSTISKAISNIFGTDISETETSSRSTPDLDPLYDFERKGGLRDKIGNRFFLKFFGGEIIYLVKDEKKGFTTQSIQPSVEGDIDLDIYFQPIKFVGSGLGSIIIDTFTRTKCKIHFIEDSISSIPEYINNEWYAFDYISPYQKRNNETKHPREATLEIHTLRFSQKAIEESCDIEELYVSAFLVEVMHWRQAEYEDLLFDTFNSPANVFDIFEYYAMIYGEPSSFTQDTQKLYSLSNLQIKCRIQYRQSKGQPLTLSLFNPIMNARLYWLGKTLADGTVITDSILDNYGLKLSLENQKIYDTI